MIVDDSLIQVAALIVMCAVVLMWALPNPQCTCPKCSFHVNERRMEHHTQEELQHEVQHKGFGFNPRQADTRDCRDKACPRNTGDRIIGP